MRFFNTVGPVEPERHYCLPPLGRIDLEEVLSLIDQRKYFVLHAPRQTGKTSCLLALMEHLNREGRYRALYANIEAAQAAREDVGQGIPAVVQAIAMRAVNMLGDRKAEGLAAEALARNVPMTALEMFLSAWCESSDGPSVLLLDEVDALVGDTLISLLRQLRAGYNKRPAQFPQSVVLCGVRDVRDYRLHSEREKAIITGGSAFNIKAKSLRLGEFVREEVEELYFQHTRETGQVFEPGALESAWELSRGQPWVVNALAYETCFEMKEGRDRTRAITGEAIEQAAENLIQRRETHLDQLADKLREERVRRVIGPMLAGAVRPDEPHPDDIAYVQDLGLIRVEKGQLVISNRIYQEVIPRELTWSTQVTTSQDPAWYMGPDGRLEMARLLCAFQEFFREHSEHWVERFDYREAGPQLLLQAFLQRVANGGGRIERKYGLGRGRTDLLVIWRHPGGVQKAVIELKILYGTLEATVQRGLRQTREYMDRCGTDDGHLVIFDRTPGRSAGRTGSSGGRRSLRAGRSRCGGCETIAGDDLVPAAGGRLVKRRDSQYPRRRNAMNPSETSFPTLQST